MYPLWVYYPKNRKPPDWVTDFVRVVADAREQIDTEHGNTKSDTVLKELAPGLSAMGFAVEVGKKHSEKIRRPVLFGDEGRPELTYDIDAFHDQLGIAVEIEAGRGAQNNADYRDLIRASLLLDARFLVLVMPNPQSTDGQGWLGSRRNAEVPCCLGILGVVAASGLPRRRAPRRCNCLTGLRRCRRRLMSRI